MGLAKVVRRMGRGRGVRWIVSLAQGINPETVKKTLESTYPFVKHSFR